MFIWGSTSCTEKGRFRWFWFPIFTVGNAIRSPTVKCFRFVCKNFTIFSFDKRIVGKLDSWAFGDIFNFKINVRIYEKLENMAIARHCNLRPPGLLTAPGAPIVRFSCPKTALGPV